MSTGRIDIIAAGCAHRCNIAGFHQDVLETTQRIIADPLVVGQIERVKRNQVDLNRHIAQQLRQFMRMVRAIIDLVNQGVFDGDLAVRIRHRLNVALGRVKQHGDRVFFIDRYQLVTQFVVRCMQGDGQARIGVLAQTIQRRHNTGCT